MSCRRKLVLVLLAGACGVVNDTAPQGFGSTTDGGTIGPPVTTALDPRGSTSIVGTTTDRELESSGEGGFITPPDVLVPCGSSPHAPPGLNAPAVALSICSVWVQDCPDGEKCTPSSCGDDGPLTWARCVELDPTPAAVGEPCTVEGWSTSGQDDCDSQSICWNVDPQTLTGTCVPLCMGSEQAPLCPGELQCAVLNYSNLPICQPTCNPLLDDCTEGMTCRPANGTFVCLPTTSGALVDPCGGTCGGGELCLPPPRVARCEGESCCSTYCDRSDPAADDGCAALVGEHVCRTFYGTDEAPQGLEHLGICGLPD